MGLIQILTDPGNFKFYRPEQPNGSENPRAIQYGRDRIDGSSSGQPFIQVTAENYNKSLFPGASEYLGNEEFIIRGGLKSFSRAKDDVVRLTKYMFNPKSPSGYLFIAKQNLLSQIAVRTETSQLGPNEGFYTPLSTLVQAGGGFLGLHANKQGLNPLKGIIAESDLPFLSRILNSDKVGGFLKNISSKVDLGVENYGYVVWTKNQNTNNAENARRETRLKDKIDNLKEKGKEKKAAKKQDKLDKLVRGNRLINLLQDNISSYTEKDNVLREYLGGPGAPYGVGTTKIYFAKDPGGNTIRTNNPDTKSGNYPLKLYSWTQETLSSQTGEGTYNFGNPGKVTDDFREKIEPTTSDGTNNKSFTFKTPGYADSSGNPYLETKFNLGNPGQKGDISDPTKGKLINGNTKAFPADTVTAYPIYKSENVKNIEEAPELNDLIPFHIAILNNDQQGPTAFKKYIHFRAFLDSFSDSYAAEWNNLEYMGRAEKFYKYKGFSRDISMGFTVVAQSSMELNAMYDKLNFLASSLAPEYLDTVTSGYMAGNIAYITVGDYIVDQPGIITGFSFEVSEESPWEIDPGRQLPHMIKVSGFKFIPIHKFRPEIVRFPIQPSGQAGSTYLGEGDDANPINQKYINPNRKRILTINTGEKFTADYPTN